MLTLKLVCHLITQMCEIREKGQGLSPLLETQSLLLMREIIESLLEYRPDLMSESALHECVMDLICFGMKFRREGFKQEESIKNERLAADTLVFLCVNVLNFSRD